MFFWLSQPLGAITFSVFLPDTVDALNPVLRSSRVFPDPWTRFSLLSLAFVSKLAPYHDVFFSVLLATVVPRLWFVASDTLVGMTSRDFTDQRVRDGTTGVRHEAVQE